MSARQKTPSKKSFWEDIGTVVIIRQLVSDHSFFSFDNMFVRMVFNDRIISNDRDNNQTMTMTTKILEKTLTMDCPDLKETNPNLDHEHCYEQRWARPTPWR
jgi:hypothetical protein